MLRCAASPHFALVRILLMGELLFMDLETEFPHEFSSMYGPWNWGIANIGFCQCIALRNSSLCFIILNTCLFTCHFIILYILPCSTNIVKLNLNHSIFYRWWFCWRDYTFSCFMKTDPSNNGSTKISLALWWQKEIPRQPKSQPHKHKKPNSTNYDKFQNILAQTASLIMSFAVTIWKADSRGKLKNQFK